MSPLLRHLLVQLFIIMFAYGGYTQRQDSSIPSIVKVFVINLEKRKDRMVSISNILNQLKIPFERFEAIDFGNGNISAIERATTRFQKGTKFNATLVRENLKQEGDEHKTWGSAGCWQSHLQIAMKIVAEQIPGPYLILEDDISISPKIVKFLSYQNLFVRLPYDWDALLLDHYFLRCHTRRRKGERRGNGGMGKGLCRVKHSFTTSGYVLRNLDVVQKFIEFGNTDRNQVIDHYWNDMFAKEEIIAYAPYQKLVAQAMGQFASDVKRDETALKKTFERYQSEGKPRNTFGIF